MPRIHRNRSVEELRSPKDVQILDLHCEPWPDGLRIRVHLTITPFQKPPNIEARLTDGKDRDVSAVNIIENVEERLVFTIHNRSGEIENPYRLNVRIYYDEIEVVQQSDISFEIQEPPPEHE